MKLSLLSAALAVALLLAGCVAGDDGPETPAPAGLPSAERSACDLGNATACRAVAPAVDARRLLDDLQDFSSSFPYRATGSPTMAGARDDLAARLEAASTEVVRHDFDGGGQNILGFHWGSDRDHWIVVGAHYDITEGAVYGAYDDGSGTAFVFSLAKAFQGVNTTRTIVFAEFDQEEMGLVGSTAFIEDVQEGRFVHAGTIEGMVDLDMVGITYPHPADLIVWENSDALTAKVTELATGVGFPQDHLQFRASGIGSSDGAAFISHGIATAYFFSDWDEYYLPGGMVQPTTPVPYVGQYPWWHKADTYDTMVISAGDEATLLAGFQNTADVVSPLLLYMAGPGFVPDPSEAEG